MSTSSRRPTVEPAARKRRSDGERSRNVILREAARLATVEGLGGLSIGRLAESVGMSKSGLFAHFGSKQELQLATIEMAGVLFSEQVVEPAGSAATGLERLHALVENFLRHVEDRVYPGGCFFAALAAETSAQPGPARDRAIEFMDGWIGRLEACLRDARCEGAIDPGEDVEQLAFEIESYLMLANAQFVIGQERAPLDRARRAIERRLAAAAPA